MIASEDFEFLSFFRFLSFLDFFSLFVGFSLLAFDLSFGLSGGLTFSGGFTGLVLVEGNFATQKWILAVVVINLQFSLCVQQAWYLSSNSIELFYVSPAFFVAPLFSASRFRIYAKHFRSFCEPD